jgi:hypothetical protein
MADRIPRDTERVLADGLRDAIERFESAQRAALAQLRNDLQAALWPADEAKDYQPSESETAR